jgi:hypothetical protein
MVNSDLVARLKDYASFTLPNHTDEKPTEKVLLEAADEIERLRSLLAGIQGAITDEGQSPAYHQQVMSRHKKEWPVLWRAIDKAMKGIG